MPKPLVVFSAVNLIEGGTLAIAKAALAAADKSNAFRTIALVHDKALYPDYKNVKLINIPAPKKNWLCRLFFEFVSSHALSIRLKPTVWFALHDITPRVISQRQFVYCHNPTPFYRAGFKDLLFSPSVFIFSYFYRFLYGINIQSNRSVFVQQCHIRDYFISHYPHNDVIVARPETNATDKSISHQAPRRPLIGPENQQRGSAVILFYPTLPRTFKNIELLIDTARLLESQNFSRFEIRITVSATESLYARYLKFSSRGVKAIQFIGRLSPEAVFEQYRQSDALVFPSKLETWGLPLSEAKSIGLPVLAADLPYARETLGNWSKVSFFDPSTPAELARQIRALAAGKHNFEGNVFSLPANATVINGWDDLLGYVIREFEQPALSA